MWNKKAVLIVDDEFIILASLKIQLARILDNDIIIEEASSCNEAKLIIDDLIINHTEMSLIISDYNLDDCKGTDLLYYCNDKFPHSKKIILSGQSDIDAILEFKEKYGLHAIFSKPWIFNDFKNSIYEIPDLVRNRKD